MDNNRIRKEADLAITDWRIMNEGFKIYQENSKPTPFEAARIRQWASETSKSMSKTIHESVNASEELSIFPYNYDSLLDDVLICTPVQTSDPRTILQNYLSCYEHLAQTAKHNHRMFGDKTIVKA